MARFIDLGEDSTDDDGHPSEDLIRRRLLFKQQVQNKSFEMPSARLREPTSHISNCIGRAFQCYPCVIALVALLALISFLVMQSRINADEIVGGLQHYCINRVIHRSEHLGRPRSLVPFGPPWPDSIPECSLDFDAALPQREHLRQRRGLLALSCPSQRQALHGEWPELSWQVRPLRS